MQDEYEICKTCHQTKPIATGFFISKVFTYGHSRDCLECRQKAKSKAKPMLLSKNDVALLQLLRNNAGVQCKVIRDRIGESAADRFRILRKKGLVEHDAEGYCLITEAGRKACPYRNRHLEAKRLQHKESRHDQA